VLTIVSIVNHKFDVYGCNTISKSSRMKTEGEWAEDVKRLLRAEMARRGVTYDELAQRLAAIGVRDTAVNLRNKVARGRFSATFLVQCLTAMDARALRLSESTNGQ
jgi:hypothetical protein